MKANIHPAFNEEIIVTCSSCGNSFKTGSTKNNLQVEVCFNCHPFFTGEQRLLDTKGRAETFRRKMENAQAYKSKAKDKKNKNSKKDDSQTKSLRELLNEA